MSTFGERLKTVPVQAWIVGFLFTLITAPLLLAFPLRYDAILHHWPLPGKIVLAVAPGLLVTAYAALIGFIYADAKRRRMRHVLWAWLALVPYFIGVILYFILREPLPTPCPQCGTGVPRTFAYCPGCGTSVHPVCARCGKGLQYDWLNCPHCGQRIAPPTAA